MMSVVHFQAPNQHAVVLNTQTQSCGTDPMPFCERTFSLDNNLLKAWSLDSPSGRGGVLQGSETMYCLSFIREWLAWKSAGLQGKDPVLKMALLPIPESRDAGSIQGINRCKISIATRVRRNTKDKMS